MLEQRKPAGRELAITDLARQVADDVTTLAKTHLELARIELSGGMQVVAADLTAVLLGGVAALIGLALLCVAGVVAIEPAIPALALRLVLGAILYLAIGAALILGLRRRLRPEERPPALPALEAQHG
jgi:uncharacterized membrane protein YqjE